MTMSQQNPLVNGCSLEDCYTNLFALTDLTGIKWRRLSAASHFHCVDPLDDPVLLSFSRCLQADILCVWKRVLKTETAEYNRTIDVTSKELWIFWYGEEPANLNGILSPELIETEQGSWDAGLSYECRTLLFKALHNLIEKCLLSRNFVRLGKWFVQPYDHTATTNDKSSHLSISFLFFLHGESTVCSSIDVRQHPPVRPLVQAHITQAQTTSQGVKVILAPYGLSGVLTGQTYKETDHQITKLLAEWKQFYPLDTCEPSARHDDESMPSMVEVLVGGMRMKYPTCYVLVTDIDGQGPRLMTSSTSSRPASMTSSAPYGDVSIHGDKPLTGTMYADGPLDPGGGESTSPMFECLLEKAWHDQSLCAGQKRPAQSGPAAGEASDDMSVGEWNFTEPVQKAHCGCSKIRSKNRSYPGNVSKDKSFSGNSKYLKMDKSEKSDGKSSKHSRVPFYRRTISHDDVGSDVDLVMTRNAVQTLSAFKGPVQASRTSNYEAESPHSAAPSPLVQNGVSASLTSSGDPVMPTLSPQPVVKEETPVCSSQPAQDQQKPGTTSANTNSGGKPSDYNTASVYHSSVVENSRPAASWMDVTVRPSELPPVQRPGLPPSSFDEEVDDEAPSSLYDFSAHRAWLDQPLKRARHDNLVAAETRSRCASPSTGDPGNQHDPYEFSDESSSTIGASYPRGVKSGSRDDVTLVDGTSAAAAGDEKGGVNHSVIDLGSLPSPGLGGTNSGSLISEKDLVPTYTDLDRIFESDDDSNDAFTPNEHGGGSCNGISKLALEPGDVRQEKPATSGTKVTGQGQGQSLASATTTPGTIGPQELSTMFPTPPSMETINTSPCGHHHLDHHMAEDPAHQAKVEPPAEENVDTGQSSPMVTTAFLGSKKYAPIELPSARLPPISVPPGAYYKPTWYAHPLPVIDKPPIQVPHSQYNGSQLTSMERSLQQPQSVDRLSVPASPAAMFHSQQQQRTPLSYDLQSPASNASSYLNKNLSSIDNHGTNSQNPEAYSLIVNITLSDTVLTVFKDHNFDSCNICVCNMSIKAADVGLHLPETNSIEPQYRCACGFSAIVNRKFGFQSGLFYEDEVEITQKRDDRFEYRKPCLSKQDEQDAEPASDQLLKLLRTQFCGPYSTCSVLNQIKRIRWSQDPLRSSYTLTNRLEFEDGYRVCEYALEQGRQAMEHCGSYRQDDQHTRLCLHKWPHIQATVPKNTQDVVRLLKSIQPLLQDAIQKKRTTRLWEATYTITGPLTWKDFHKLAGRGSEEACEPQPIPSLLVGYDKDWLSIAPHAIRYWEKLLLEPYRKPRDVAYVVVAPENDQLLNHIKKYFKELSSVYELCRLGRHSPIGKVLRDGIMRVGRNQAKKLSDDDMVGGWFENLYESSVAGKLKLYAQVCRHLLAPHLSEQSLDKTLFESPASVKSVKQNQAPTPLSTSQPSPHTPLQDAQVSSSASTPQSVSDDREGCMSESADRLRESSAVTEPEVDDPDEQPTIVVYMVDPFTYGDDCDEASRLSMLGLLRCYHELILALPASMHDYVKLQIIPLQSIMDSSDEAAHLQNLKSISFSVYTQSAHPMSYTISGRTLTGFGTAAAAETFLKQKQSDMAGSLCLYTPPFILAPRRQKPSLDPPLDVDKASILLCAYCLSEDQRWLVAVCTDERGELLETCTINIDIPNRNRRKKASARRSGLHRLWEFLVGVISMTNRPWRLVVSRLGRLGHGEMKGWAGLLGRKNLLNVNKTLKDKCDVCSVTSLGDTACILSACLIGMEVQPTFRVMPDVVKAEETQSSNIPVSTPKDASCTHILVFPTSATAAANSAAQMQESHIDIASSLGADIGDDDPFFSSLKEDLNLDQDLNGIFNLADSPVPSPGSPDRPSGASSLMSPGTRSSPQFMVNRSGSVVGSDPQDESPNLLQQPLAMGYYVSTARPGPLPRWMWSSCAHMENNCPTCFKFSLHVHSPGITQNQDDLLHSTNNRPSHPLDSNFTCDVLRSVLETYNSLSWLTMDMATNDRRSCLPHHFMILTQLYNALDAFI